MEDATRAATTGLIRSLPKAEVHVHLEGAIERDELLDLARVAGVELPGPAETLLDVSTHHVPAQASELSAYLRFLDWEGSLVRTAEQVARIAYRFAARQTASGIVYTDVIVNPTHWAPWGGRLGELFSALREGFDAAEVDGLCVVGICVSLDRGQRRTEAVELSSWLVEHRPARVVALSIDGDERVTGRTGHVFAEAFEIARNGGLARTVHAGESSGAEGVWDAVRFLHADRVDHGIRAIDDDRLLDHLAERRIPLGVCPTSNLVLGVAPDLLSHPITVLRERGVIVTVNTDDPAPLSTSLEHEWLICAEAFGWGPEALVDLAASSLRASFAPPELVARALSDLARLDVSGTDRIDIPLEASR